MQQEQQVKNLSLTSKLSLNLIKLLVEYLDFGSLHILLFQSNKGLSQVFQQDQKEFLNQILSKQFIAEFGEKLLRTEPEDKYPDRIPYLKDINYIDAYKAVYQFRYSEHAKELRSLKNQMPSPQDLAKFAIHVADEHSWYKHLPLYPGKQTMMFQYQTKNELNEDKEQYIRYPQCLVNNDTKKDKIVNYWGYQIFYQGQFEKNIRIKKIKNADNPYILKLLNVNLNSMLSRRSRGFHWTNCTGAGNILELIEDMGYQEHIKDFEQVKEKVEKKRKEEEGKEKRHHRFNYMCDEFKDNKEYQKIAVLELLRQMDAIIETSQIFIKIVYGVDIPFSPQDRAEYLEKRVEKYY